MGRDTTTYNFNPRYPYRYRRASKIWLRLSIKFQSTISIQISTRTSFVNSSTSPFQSTISIQISTPSRRHLSESLEFQSTISIQISTRKDVSSALICIISIHDIHTDIDVLFDDVNYYNEISIHDIHTDIDTSLRQKQSLIVISIHDIHTDIDCIFCNMAYHLPISIHDIHTDIDKHQLQGCCHRDLFQSTISIQISTL